MILESLKVFRDHLLSDNNARNSIGECPICGSNIKDRTITLYQELIDALYQVYIWCGEHRRHEFSTKDIRHLLSRNNYARFGDLVRFGGLVYKPKDEDGKSHKAEFGLNMARAREFYGGTREIPVQITINPLTGEIISSKYVTVKDFPSIVKLLDENGLYDYNKLF